MYIDYIDKINHLLIFELCINHYSLDIYKINL
jgi:hypothetical protein